MLGFPEAESEHAAPFNRNTNTIGAAYCWVAMSSSDQSLHFLHCLLPQRSVGLNCPEEVSI